MPVGYHYKREYDDAIWYRDENDRLHRTDGPAVEYFDGSCSWYKHGKLHRTDGPAIDWVDGSKQWWVDSVRLTEEEFNLRYPPKEAELPKVKSKYKF
jgi:hypothetical protein